MSPAYVKSLSRLQQYALLMRLHRPIGISLLLWPTLMALWLAGRGQPEPRLVVIFVLGVIVMRSAGCVINDFADRHFDGHVERTQARPLAAGKVKPWEAIGLFSALLLLGLVLAWQLDPQTLRLSVIGAGLATIYPFLKRVTYFPQIGLGVAFGWAVPMAYSAQAQKLTAACWILYAATLLWAVAYDTLYAVVDKEDDKKIGIKSTALWLEGYDKMAVAVLQVSVLSLFFLLGKITHLGIYYYSSLVVAFLLAGYQQWLIRFDPQGYFKAFLNNHWFGAVLFVGVMLDFWLRS